MFLLCAFEEDAGQSLPEYCIQQKIFQMNFKCNATLMFRECFEFQNNDVPLNFDFKWICQKRRSETKDPAITSQNIFTELLPAHFLSNFLSNAKRKSGLWNLAHMQKCFCGMFLSMAVEREKKMQNSIVEKKKNAILWSYPISAVPIQYFNVGNEIHLQFVYILCMAWHGMVGIRLNGSVCGIGINSFYCSSIYF